ncbi:MAG: hypothetical protein O3A10_02835 [Chloroflexi bacterium]|nr:hypothetical protein [Chloroflexota bacterium]MDA1145158.1 hypothetical protein [Chloroflexota bacterium]
MSFELLLLSWYGGVAAILGGLTLPLGPLRPWTFRLGVAVITAAAVTMGIEYLFLPD